MRRKGEIRQKGTPVEVNIPPVILQESPMLAEFQGMVTTISKVIWSGHDYYYELAGARSKYGIPYSFMREWLVL